MMSSRFDRLSGVAVSPPAIGMSAKTSLGMKRFRRDARRGGASQEGSVSGDPDSPWFDRSGSAPPSLDAARRSGSPVAASIGPRLGGHST